MTRLKAGRAPAGDEPAWSVNQPAARPRPSACGGVRTDVDAGEVVCRLRDFRIVAGGHRIEQPRLCAVDAGEVVCRLRDFRIVAGGHRIEQPRLCAVDVIGRALPHRLPGSVCPFQLSPPRSRRGPPGISETRPNPAESPPPIYQPRQNDQHPVRVLFSWNRAGERPRHVTRATGGHRRRFQRC